MTLEARTISIKIGKKTLLDNISLQVEPGELVAVVGANGAGKSTLLKTLAGDMKPAHGSIWMGGKRLDTWKMSERAQVRSVLPQSSNLTFAFTVLEIALMGRAPHVRGTERPQDYAIARQALTATETLHLEDRIYTTLSGGERQRVQLARVLAQIWEANGSPRYLLIDEPTSGLDLAHQHSFMEIAHTFSREGVAVLAILHDLNLAAQYADRIVVLHQGQHVATGTPREVLTPDLIDEAFHFPVLVMDHPQLNYPLIIPVAGPGARDKARDIASV